MKSHRRPAQGATRRAVTPAETGLDRWLNRLVTIFVTTAMVVGGLALLVTLLF
ncbi:hypothetical protein [Salinicola rhizosphaerae]|uniref:Uncharacterized protein n=1 Tax=Salinicola rhizosphaerae TaxID=1443141 RepID=A0ABQ3E1E4_9GAMM|nr:hypothetical protein [Salinicola rhizosphaerae]GHB21900.1 hypothetical protein GCM10009038_21000 [Salinicola rhizosphaerae]